MRGCGPALVGEQLFTNFVYLSDRSRCSGIGIVGPLHVAQGKSYITKMLQRYLQWSGFPVRIFNAGNIRRLAAGRCMASW